MVIRNIQSQECIVENNGMLIAINGYCLMREQRSNGPGSVVGIATAYGLDGSGIESRWR
jgi:hypothetical protein